jgi:hypothetical protein
VPEGARGSAAALLELVGPPGIGKSTTARAVAALLAQRGVQCRSGGLYEVLAAEAQRAASPGALAQLGATAPLHAGVGLLALASPRPQLAARRARRLLGWLRRAHGLLPPRGGGLTLMDEGPLNLLGGIGYRCGALRRRLLAWAAGAIVRLYPRTFVLLTIDAGALAARWEQRRRESGGAAIRMYDDALAPEANAGPLAARVQAYFALAARACERFAAASGSRVVKVDAALPPDAQAEAIVAAWLAAGGRG